MKYFIIAIALSVSLFSCKSSKYKPEEWKPLWNGKDFTGWHTYLGPPYQIKKDSLGNEITPFGIDNDPLKVITVTPVNKENTIRISGVAWGMIYTEKEYKNYHLKLKVKWGEDRHPPREKSKRDSGLLYHGHGEIGAVNNWMNSQELQIQEGDMGDYWPVGTVEIDVPSVLRDDGYYTFRPDAVLRGYYRARKDMTKRRVIKSLDAEKPYGEWNEIELIVFGDSSIHIVNGNVVMELFNSRKVNKEPLASGKIILQSEGSEVFYKDIQIKEISKMPKEYSSK